LFLFFLNISQIFSYKLKLFYDPVNCILIA